MSEIDMGEIDIDYYKKQMRRFCNDTVVRCPKCGRTQYLKFSNGLRNGWSICCGYTMPIIYCEADINKAVYDVIFPQIKRIFEGE